MNHKPVFDAVRQMLGRGFRQAEVDALDQALKAMELVSSDCDLLAPYLPSRTIGPAGLRLIKRFEACAMLRSDGMVEAYPDPGSGDGNPWTIGWGSTGPEIGPGTVWSQKQCDERFARDLKKYATEVREAIGEAPTTQNQFDALVSFHYNTGAIGRATLTKLHKRGAFLSAAREFAKWVHNDGKAMKGLQNRRQAEIKLYLSPDN